MTTIAAPTKNEMNESLVEEQNSATDVESSREAEAYNILNRNMLWAMGISLIPMPLVDFVGITAIQVKALNELSDHYEIPFLRHKVKNIIASLLSGLGVMYGGTALATSLFSIVPGLGTLAHFTAMPVMAGAMTYALGVVFIQHFESGGTFLTFDPKKVRAFFKEKYKEGLQLATEMQKNKPAATAAAGEAEKKAAAR